MLTSSQQRAHWLRMLAIGAFFVLIEAAIRLTAPGLEHWHYALHRLYYLAIIGGGLSFGWIGGLITALISSGFYLLHTSGAESPDARNDLDRYLETIILCLVGLLAGILSDRERNQRDKAERAGQELSRVYKELQDNVEHLKRAARLSSLGHMSAGLAHEIRNPLAGIEGAASILMNEAASESRRIEFLGIILKECRRLNRLVTNFLQFARPRAPELQVVNVDALIEATVDVVRQTAGRHQVEFTIDVPASMPPLECDAEQIKQVLLNLVLNAVQAMPDGGRVMLSARAENDTVTVRIADTGTGIPAADIDSIYDPFFTTKETGTGLGLPTAYQIVQQHGGELSLEKSDRSGSSFAFTLPVHRVQNAHGR